MTEPIQQVDQTSILTLLLEQFKYRRDGTTSNLSKMISMVAAELNLTEQALQELLPAFDITTAVGAQLDILGSIFGSSRGGLSDTAYRAAILTAATASASGTAEQLIGAVRAIIGGSSPIRLQNAPPAKVYLYTDTGALSGITQAQAQYAAPAGVGVILVDFRCTDDFVFRETDDLQTRAVGG
jgi:hypothetical protein